MTLTLYKRDGSPPARATMMTIAALKLTGVEYVDVNLSTKDPYKEDFLKLNPQHTVPTLKDGDFAVWDSHAITVYLVTKYGEDDFLYPSDPQKRAIIDQRLHFDSGVLFPALRATAGPVLYHGEKTFRPENLEMIKGGYDFMEKFLTFTWLAGDKFTLADICCVATISSSDKILPIDADKYPKLTAWLQRCSELEIYKKVNLPGLTTFGELFKMTA